VDISSKFNIDGGESIFENSGLFINGVVTTLKSSPVFNGNSTVLGDIILNGEVTDEFYIDECDLQKWRILKGPKKSGTY
jgi:hypothetical protein